MGSAVKIAASTIPDTISKVLFSFILLHFYPTLAFPKCILNFIISHSTPYSCPCVSVCGHPSKLKLVSRSYVYSFLPQMLILFASWHKVDLTFLIARCMRQLSGRFFFAIQLFSAIVTFPSFYLRTQCASLQELFSKLAIRIDWYRVEHQMPVCSLVFGGN